jgi:hypothetical protein
MKNPVTPLGIDPGTVRLLAQRLNHYATPGPVKEYNLQHLCYHVGNVPALEFIVTYQRHSKGFKTTLNITVSGPTSAVVGKIMR